MSHKSVPHPHTVIEWSPKGVAVLDPSSRSVRRFDTVQEAAGLIGAQPVVVAVSRRALFARTMRVPNASTSEIEMIVRMKLGEVFPLPPADLAYSVDLTPDVSPEGRLAVLVAMSAIELRNLHEEFRRAGFKVHSVVPISYGSVLLANSLQRANCAVASRDESGVGIDIVHDGFLRYSRVAPPTGDAAGEVCRTYAVAGLPCGDIVAADGLLLDDAAAISAISPLEALSGAWPTMVPALELPEAVALRASKERSRSLRVSGILFIAGLVLALAIFFNFKDSKDAAAEATAEYAKQTTDLKLIERDAEKKASDAKIIENSLRRGFDPAQGMADVIVLATNSAPADVWLTSVSLDRGRNLLIRGLGRDSSAVNGYVAALIAATGDVDDLKVSVMPRLREVKLISAEAVKIDQTAAVQFSITAFPVGNLPLVDPNQKTVVKK
ncbi:hypothetical protein BH11ARM1_BH11ARM1_06820 [soil metagenome]